MGTSTNGMLVYGYNLGGDESGWEIEEVGEYDELDTDQIAWLNADADEDEDEEGQDFVAYAEKRLLESVGFTETDWKADGYFDRKRTAEERLGVEFDSYCSGDYPMYVLAAHVITARRGDALPIDFTALTQQAVDEDWDAKLAHAIQALAITPKQEKPGWILCSYWG